MAKWQTMRPAKRVPLHAKRKRELEAWGVRQGFDTDRIAALIADAENAETWMNNLYVANVEPAESWVEGWPSMKHLSIRRIDRKAIHDWRHLQRIKSDIFGAEAEAVELYPSEARVVDTANSYHLWVLAEPGTNFPFGWPTGLRSDDCAADIPNQQRPGSETE